MNRFTRKIEVFSQMTIELSTLSTCKRGLVGCMIISNDFRRVHAMGYNGWPHGFDHSNCSGDPCGCVHAELNACIKLGDTGYDDNWCFITRKPCIRCAQAIIQTEQISRVVIVEPDDRASEGVELLRRADIAINTRG